MSLLLWVSHCYREEENGILEVLPYSCVKVCLTHMEVLMSLMNLSWLIENLTVQLYRLQTKLFYETI